MVIKSKKRAPIGSAATASKINLADVLLALNGQKTVSETRLRDLRSSVKRMALLLEDDPARIPLDLPAISAQARGHHSGRFGSNHQDLCQYSGELHGGRKGERIENQSNPPPGSP